MKTQLRKSWQTMLNGLLGSVLALVCLAAVAQAQTVSGRITAVENGEPLPGVNVLVRGTNQGTTTDNNGKYTLKLPSANATIAVSFIGYSKQEIAVGGRSTIDISLEVDTKALGEVVVVGYGTQEKVNLTGAVGVADSKRLMNRPIANAGEGLQGVIPNLNVNVRNGDPAQPVTFNIRGYESINGGAPLVLVDGVPMDLNRLNPNDIESVSVLKDASAAAVYGARAAFGVVLVTTKSGKSGKVTVNFNTQTSLAKPIFNMDVVTDPYEFVQARNAANIRTNGVPTYDADYVAKTKAYSENPATAQQWGVVNGTLRFYGFNDYQRQIMTDFAPTTQHDLSVSGGSEKSKFFVSLGYFSKDGYLREKAKNEAFKRYNFLAKADFKINEWISFDSKVIFNSQNSNKPHFYNWDVNINSLARVPPIQAIQFPDLEYYITPGDREKYAPYIGKYFGGTNFFPYLKDGGRTTFTNNDLWLTQGVTLTPLKGLKIRSDFSYNIFNRMYQDVQSKIEIVSEDLRAANPISNGFSGDDWVRTENNYNQYYVFNAYAEYKLPLPVSHNLTAMVGFNQELGQNRYTGAQARALITPLVTDLNATTGVQQTFGAQSHVALRGAFYRLNYNYKERYLLELNGRYDGTSRFPQASRFGFFPSFSAGWRISNEKFMQSLTWLDNLKIRASYGTLGNQLLGNNFYPYVATLGSGQSPYMFSNAAIPVVRAPGLVSPSLTWETVISQNLGLDFTLLKGRLDGSFDLFMRDTKDMLMDVSYPAILGVAAPKENAADLRTKGWELSLTWRDRIKKDWNYDLTLALSDWTSSITKFNNPTGALPNNNNIFYVGQQLGEIWGLETAGIFQTVDDVAKAPRQTNIGANWRPGDIQYVDVNGDGVISYGNNTLANPGDRKIIGNTTPRYTFGINGGLSYKNFRMTVFFQGIGKKDHWPSSDNWNWFFPYNAGHVERYYITDTWREDNRDAYFPAAHVSTNDKKNVQVQSRYLQSAAYIRLKNIMFSYDLPSSWMKKIGAGRASIFTTGMNLWEFTKMRKPLDPEAIQTGAIEYPMQRIFTLGANVTF
jgi:TonB-linked SusC/RagA family outer membrane protein